MLSGEARLLEGGAATAPRDVGFEDVTPQGVSHQRADPKQVKPQDIKLKDVNTQTPPDSSTESSSLPLTFVPHLPKTSCSTSIPSHLATTLSATATSSHGKPTSKSSDGHARVPIPSLVAVLSFPVFMGFYPAVFRG